MTPLLLSVSKEKLEEKKPVNIELQNGLPEDELSCEKKNSSKN